MKERSILFSGPMVRAILDGRKTQTRRVIKPQPKHMPLLAMAGLTIGCDPSIDGSEWYDADCINPGVRMHCKQGYPGDRLIVKEAAWMWCERRPNGKTKTSRPKWLYVPLKAAPVRYCAEQPEKPLVDVVHPETKNQWGWRKKIGRFLPAWASRLTLEITGVQVGRVQDISEEDARAEGVRALPDDSSEVECDWSLCPRCGGTLLYTNHTLEGSTFDVDCYECATFKKRFRILWDNINAERGFSWESNPWVWVIEFRKL